MPKKLRRRSEGRSIDELAHLFLTNKYTLRGMINKFGEKAARQAITEMAEAINLCDPGNDKARRWLNPIITGNSSISSTGLITGQSIKMMIFDDPIIRETEELRRKRKYLKYDKSKGRQTSPKRSRH